MNFRFIIWSILNTKTKQSVYICFMKFCCSIIPGTDKLLKASEAFVHQTQEKMDKMTSEIQQDFLRLLEELQLENDEEVTQLFQIQWFHICFKN